jgi:hypothetical protein
MYGLETCADRCVARSALLLVGAGAPTERGRETKGSGTENYTPAGRTDGKDPRERERGLLAWRGLCAYMRIMRSRDRTCSKYSCGAEPPGRGSGSGSLGALALGRELSGGSSCLFHKSRGVSSYLEVLCSRVLSSMDPPLLLSRPAHTHEKSS